MKFAKELASKMVQEWQAAYMDYNTLKQVLKNLMIFRQQRAAMPPPPPAISQRRSSHRGDNVRESSRSNGDSVITVSSVRQEQSTQNYYKNMLQRSMDEGGGFELDFFTKLDDEFNKVVKFYKDKVESVKMEAEELSKSLASLRNNVDLPDVDQNFAAEFHSGREKQG